MSILKYVERLRHIDFLLRTKSTGNSIASLKNYIFHEALHLNI